MQLKNDQFDEDIKKVETELQSSKETLQQYTVYLNEEIKNVKTTIQSTQRGLVEVQRKKSFAEKTS